MRNNAISDDVKKRLLSGELASLDLPFHSITISQPDPNTFEVLFRFGGKAVFWMNAPVPNFSAGEVLTISGINGTTKGTLE